ncbi:PTS sugar transporter subunit IIB [Halobacillus massiliensis]|uniref:PTS sugar transporter subunit IIB n=1 Tax=Halobacillus massiliensis TaxID=1926286 RepID=UPI0009E47849|nr:PTS sugar transporter subunit IIB [Halobacillus massiliensis]
MTKKITLVCNQGLSTSMVVKKMQESANNKGIEAHIEAVPESSLKKSSKDTHVILLGPQISYKLKSFKDEYQPQGIKVEVINGADYGMLNGEKILQDALSLMEG